MASFIKTVDGEYLAMDTIAKLKDARLITPDGGGSALPQAFVKVTATTKRGESYVLVMSTREFQALAGNSL